MKINLLKHKKMYGGAKKGDYIRQMDGLGSIKRYY